MKYSHFEINVAQNSVNLNNMVISNTNNNLVNNIKKNPCFSVVLEN